MEKLNRLNQSFPINKCYKVLMDEIKVDDEYIILLPNSTTPLYDEVHICRHTDDKLITDIKGGYSDKRFCYKVELVVSDGIAYRS